MDRKAKGGHLRVGRADEDAVAPRGDELVDEEAEPRRVDAVVVRHQQHRRLRRRSRRRGVHTSGSTNGEAFRFRSRPRLPFVRLLAIYSWVSIGNRTRASYLYFILFKF